MKLTCNRELLCQATAEVSKVVVPSSSIPEIGGILLEVSTDTCDIKLTGTNIRSYIQRIIKEALVLKEGELLLPASLLLNMLSKLSGETVEIELDTKTQIVRIRSGAAEYEMSAMPAKAYPRYTLPYPDYCIAVTGLSAIAKRTVYATSPACEGKAKEGVKLDFSHNETRAYASDGIRMTEVTGRCADGDLSMILHSRALEILCSIISPQTTLYAGIVDKTAVFFCEGLLFATLLLPGPYLAVDQVIGQIQAIAKASVDARNFYMGLVAICSSLRPQDDQCVNLQVDSDKVVISAVTAAGSSRTEIPTTFSNPTPPTGYNYNPRYLLDYARRAMRVGQLFLNFDERGFLLITSGTTKYAVAPRRPAIIRTPEAKKAVAKKKKAPKEAAPNKAA